MKRLISLVAIIITLIACPFSGKANTFSADAAKYTSMTDIIKVEYVFMDGLWWKFTYFSDGSIQIQASATAGD